MAKFFRSSASKWTFGPSLGALLIGGALFVSMPDEVSLQSLESKTTTGGRVFNRIKFLQTKGKDIWMMNQSHHGADAASEQWDRLAIIVEKNAGARQASFYQLPPGELKWTEDLPMKRLPYKVSCFMCHSNGPRAIRSASPLSPLEKLRVAAWNFRIKISGQVKETSFQEKEDLSTAVPFRHRSKIENDTLAVKTCVLCHDDRFWFQRGKLTRQNALAIQFMTEKNLMPPPGFRLTDEERTEISDFLKGF